MSANQNPSTIPHDVSTGGTESCGRGFPDRVVEPLGRQVMRCDGLFLLKVSTNVVVWGLVGKRTDAFFLSFLSNLFKAVVLFDHDCPVVKPVCASCLSFAHVKIVF